MDDLGVPLFLETPVWKFAFYLATLYSQHWIRRIFCKQLEISARSRMAYPQMARRNVIKIVKHAQTRAEQRKCGIHPP